MSSDRPLAALLLLTSSKYATIRDMHIQAGGYTDCTWKDTTLKRFKVLVALAFWGFLAVFPLVFSNPAITTVAVFTLLFAAAATGWNIFSGYTGYISIGHAAFYGLGAYFLALLCLIWNVPAGWLPFFLMPVVGLMTGICAVPIGWVVLKTRRYRFLVLTIAIFALCSQIPNFLENTPLGGAELSLPMPAWSGAVFNQPFYYTALILLALAVALSWWIHRSKFGLALLAIRDDEDRALGLAVNTELYKLIAFIISTIIVSMVGAMIAYFLEFVSPPSAFDPSFNIFVPLLAFLGGIGTPLGPLLGALVAVPLQQYITLQFGTQDWDLILYGACFLLIILLLPEGLLPTLNSKWHTWSKTFNNLIYGRRRVVSTSHAEAGMLNLTGFTITNRAPDITDAKKKNSLAVYIKGQANANSARLTKEAKESHKVAAIVITEQKQERVQQVEASYSYSTQHDTQAAFQQAFTSGLLSQSTIQKLRPIRLIEMPQETGISSPTFGAGGAEILPRSSRIESEMIRPAPVPLASDDRGSLDIRRSKPLETACPRCGSTLRVVQTMIFCRRCGLIVSGKQG